MKWAVLTSIFLSFILISFCLYWFAIRPSTIKHDCSWVKKHSDATPGRPAMTKEELEAKRVIRTCKNEFELVNKIAPHYNINSNIVPHLFDPNYTSEQTQAIWDATSCREDGDKVIAEYKNPIEAKPAKDWNERATTQQYQFCLHDKGL